MNTWREPCHLKLSFKSITNFFQTFRKRKGLLILMEVGNLSFPCLQATWPSEEDKEEGHLVVYLLILTALLVFDESGVHTAFCSCPGCLAEWGGDGQRRWKFGSFPPVRLKTKLLLWYEDLLLHACNSYQMISQTEGDRGSFWKELGDVSATYSCLPGIFWWEKTKVWLFYHLFL